ncbi:MAG: methionine aminotransferase [Gammaproteobacteria bacterium]|nr:methionine aminotransferase [Gammaproteobacteria bacterium]|tara:strand:+ start:6801 stop:7964 length:1164 start_codon:yes stop_codon:yes gene_type:complete
MTIESKFPGVGTTIFTIMSQMANDHGAINLSQGFPDFSPPVELLEMCEKYLRGGYNQYPPMSGVPYLREQIALKLERLYQTELDPDSNITITSGATESLFVAIQSVVRPGDEVIVFDPAYDSYEPAVTMAGGQTIHVPMAAPNFHIDFDRLGEAINIRTRLIIVNSPHNPCGSIISAADLEKLASMTRQHDLYILSDEVYEHMVYDGAIHHSLLTNEELRNRSFVVSSFGKTYHATGWKVAYCAAPVALTAEFRKIHQFVTFTTHTPTQWALAEYMEQTPDHYLQLPAFYQAKRDLFNSAMTGSGFNLTPSAGTYFQLADYSDLSDQDDVAFSSFLTQQVGVAAIPISVFRKEPTSDRLVRFCFAKEDETIIKAAALLCSEKVEQAK